MEEESMKLRLLNEQEIKEVLSAFEVFKQTHGVVLNAIPRFTDDGRVEVTAQFLKIDNGTNTDTKD